MKTIHIDIDIKEYNLLEMSADDQQLINTAIKATEHSYSIYSHFSVGAAVKLANGKIILGANQENAAYPSGLCAERTAIFAAQVQYPDQPITTIAIAARNKEGLLCNPITPCGACRQVMLEIEARYHKPVRVLLYGSSKVYEIKSVGHLMPLSFDGDML